MSTTTFIAPRIVYLFPALIAAASSLTNHLKNYQKMGFTHVMITADTDFAIDCIASACNENDLGLLLDFDVSLTSLKKIVSPEQYGDVLPDPRMPSGTVHIASIGVGTAALSASELAYWNNQLEVWITAGASGFCCRALATKPKEFWQSLLVQARNHQETVAFIAWTPGCTPAQINALSGCGFDATVASTAWWDYSSPWLAEEAARLGHIAPAIATVDDPLHPILRRNQFKEDDVYYARCIRAINTAAASACGTLVPMGLEFLSTEITAANVLATLIAARPMLVKQPILLPPTLVGPGVKALLRQPKEGNAKGSDDALLIIINQSTHTTATLSSDLRAACFASRVAQEIIWPETAPMPSSYGATLAPGALIVLAARQLPAIVCPPARGKRVVDAACRAPRIAIEEITPAVDGGQFPVKRIVGDRVDVEADILMDGHDKLGVLLLWRPADTVGWQEIRMNCLGNDRWHAVLPLLRVGRYRFAIQAWRDAFATYRDELAKKVAAGLDVSLELEEGRLLIKTAAAHAEANGRIAAAATLSTVVALFSTTQSASGKNNRSKASAEKTSQKQLIATVLADETTLAMQEADDRPFAVRSEPELCIDAERIAARFSSWYELFPRSQSGDVQRHGTFADVEKRLPAISDMGFDTLYLPPIHPIGKTNRKGPNNSLAPNETGPGSPYAIGSAAGGHDAVHPELGTLADFRRLSAAARNLGLEIALDFAIQCSPDHPWVKSHPDWFDWRQDGSMPCAENPPKKYEDIVNVNFYALGAIPALWVALRDVVLFWVNEGVRVFRVAHSHSKPLPFWQWIINDIRNRSPDVIFLSEALTRPKVMHRLAKVGFSQSYTYFTWRHTKAEFTDYLTELSTTPLKDYFRPHFFVNTPDINPVFLQKSGRPGFLIRAALATTLSGLWGMYSGFELCEAIPVPDKEDYLDSEKYEVRAWDWQRPGNIIAEITLLNHIRKAHPALQSHLGVHFLEASNPNILCFIKFTPQPPGTVHLGHEAIFVAINLDPSAVHGTTFSLPFWRIGLPEHGTLAVEDLVHGNRFTLHGQTHQLQLDPNGLPYAIWRLQN